MATLSGSCGCGAVRFTLGSLPVDAGACHCGMCRKQSGHYFASANVPKTDVSIEGADHLTWYQSSGKARRGFCSRCGSWLFWESTTSEWLSVALGSIDGDTGIELERHIFVAFKGDYYTIGDNLPQQAD